MAGKSKSEPDPRIDKRRVTMVSVMASGRVVDGKPEVIEHRVVDYVRPDFLDAYVADAKTKWQSVTVSDEPDAGPGGYDGATHVPARLSHPLAGQTFPAEEA
jgi:hypothetical protein